MDTQWSVLSMLMSNLPAKTFEYFTKAIDILASSSNQIKTIQAEFIKFSHEEERKEKERNRPPKVYFEKECPYPDNVEPPKKNEQAKQNEATKPSKVDTPPAKKPPQYLNYQKDGQPAAQRPPKPPAIIKPTNKQDKVNTSGDKQPKLKGKTPPKDKEDSPPPSSVNDFKKSTVANPLRPKQPISAFIRFNKAHMNEVKKEYPHMMQTDLVTVTGYMWSSLPEQIKRKYEEEYQRDKEKYEAELAQFYRKNPNQKKSKKQIQREKQAAINARKL